MIQEHKIFVSFIERKRRGGIGGGRKRERRGRRKGPTQMLTATVMMKEYIHGAGYTYMCACIYMFYFIILSDTCQL